MSAFVHSSKQSKNPLYIQPTANPNFIAHHLESFCRKSFAACSIVTNLYLPPPPSPSPEIRPPQEVCPTLGLSCSTRSSSRYESPADSFATARDLVDYFSAAWRYLDKQLLKCPPPHPPFLYCCCLRPFCKHTTCQLFTVSLYFKTYYRTWCMSIGYRSKDTEHKNFREA